MTINKLGKRILALVLALVMCFSTLQLTSIAASVKNQVMDGYYVLNEDGSVKDTVTEAAVTEDGFTISKTIEQTGVNQFDITLQVSTQQTVTENASAIQLVIDRSNSMKVCANCGKESCNCNAGTRMAAVKSAITGEGGFLDQLLAGNKGKLYISVVAFSGHHNQSSVKDAYVVLDWTELSAETKSSVAGAVNNISANGGTNLQAGLTLGANRLSMDAIASCSAKYTVLLTDGAPTYYTSGTQTSVTEITSTLGDGSTTNSNTINGGISGATAVKAKSTLYTICYGVANDTLVAGTTSSKCANCNEDRDDHITACVNCHQSRNTHTWTLGGRKCSGKSTYYKAGEFCPNKNYTTQFEASVSGSMTVGEYLSGSIASSANTAYNASDIEEVYSAFANIANSAIQGMDGSGTIVTDPMGEYIVLGDVSGKDYITVTGEGFSWGLNEATLTTKTEGNTTTYTYTYTYPITLDTSAQGFREDVCYPTNGYTYLSVPQEDGSVKKIAFNVPSVCGEIPEYSWKVEYYLQNADGSYTLDESEDMGLADLWTSVNAPEGYETKYDRDNYSFASGNTTLQISAGENVMKLYYNRDMANVTVNHYYKTTTINADGTVTEGEYPAAPQIKNSETKWVGTDFSASAQTTYGGAEYNLDKKNPNDAQIKVSADATKNVIDFYYSRTVDDRADTSAEVLHVYKTFGYVLDGGRYVLKELSSETVSAQSASNLKATTTYAVNSSAPLSSHSGYTLNTSAGDYAALLQADNTLSFVLVENAEANVRTLVFEKIEDKRVSVEVTVNHYYTKSTTSVQDGAVVTVIDPDNELGKIDTFSGYYVGETFNQASQTNAYEGDTYNSDAGNAAKCEAITLNGNTVIDLYYNLTVVPDTVSITVNHYWRTHTAKTVEDVDSDGNVIGTKVVNETTVDNAIEGNTISNLYAGQNYTAALESWGEGYTFNEADSDSLFITVVDGAVINLYYDRDAKADVRDDASIDVLHNYTTHLTTIVDGAVGTITLNDGSVHEDSVTMKAGDTFTAVAKPSYNGNDYPNFSAESELTKVLQPGANATIVINYERNASDLVPVTYNVNYEYRTYTMTINEEGVAGYWDAPVVDTTGSLADMAGYVGLQVTLPAGEREGFTALTTNPATVQILKSEDNTWTFVYEKYIPLDMGSVVVNHHYKTITIAENGTSSEETQDVLGTAAQMYLGESYLALSAPGTFQLTSAKLDGEDATASLIALMSDETVPGLSVVVSGENVVDFYYEKTVDNSRLVDYSVSHIYNLYTYNGILISSNEADPITGSGYVTTEFTAVADPAGYDLVSVTYNEEALEAPYTIALADGKNEIVFVYELYEARAEVEVTVIHNYYENEEAVGGTPIEVYEEHITDISEDTDYTAQMREEEGYEFHSATPSSLTITATKDGENLIILNYTKVVVEEPPAPPVVDIPDEDPPMAEVPKTGDSFAVYAVLTALSGMGLTVLGLKKKEESEE